MSATSPASGATPVVRATSRSTPSRSSPASVTVVALASREGLSGPSTSASR
ncbi:hypothetical protein ACFQQB_66120 [Nonomuraea rubra]|uniref:hypothetical protein n=1 Tax=Nonomuraea rubra TaxID=46180 RepID=UPI0031E77A98